MTLNEIKTEIRKEIQVEKQALKHYVSEHEKTTGSGYIQALTWVLTLLNRTDDKLQEKLAKLEALEIAGVDNWSGYEYAMEILYGADVNGHE